jgi:hypothetical protein
MRTVIQPQLKLGETDIAAIMIDHKSRDNIPQLLRGLQHIYTDASVRGRVFSILEEVLPGRLGAGGKASAKTGRPGMEQWKILVLGVLRLGLNADYDRIQELANQHNTIRQMLGHSDWMDESHYELQTIKDNLNLFTSEILDRINQVVIHAGHQTLKKSPEKAWWRVATLLWWRLMCIFPRTLIYCGMPSAKPSKRVSNSAMPLA